MESIRNELLAYVEALWRRRWFAVVVAWLLAMVGWGVVAILPDQYRSSSQIYVETQSLLGPLLKNLAVDSTDSRAEVLVMQRTLLSRPNLEKVARATDLHLRANDPVAVEKLLESINSHTSVTMDAPNLFTVSFTDADAQMAKEVVQKLINIFVESNLGQSRADMENARAFIERQIAQYEAQLKAADQRIAEFRGQNVNILSGNVTFAARLEMTRQSVIEARLALEDSISRRDQLAANLKTIPQTMDGPAMAVGASPQAARVAELQKSLDAMKLRGFTDEHPDVAATRRALDQAMSEGGGRGGGGYSVSRMSNPLYEQIKLRLVDAEATVATAQRRVQQTQQDSERLKEMAQAAPGIEAQLADMQREYGVLRSNYEQLLSRRESARISQAVETSADKIQFRVVSPPFLPSIPSGPPRMVLLSAVLVAAFGVGTGAALLLGRTEDTVSRIEALESFGLPVYGGVSLVETVEQRARRAMDGALLVTGVVTLVLIYGFLMIYAHDLGALARAAQQFLPSLTERLNHG